MNQETPIRSDHSTAVAEPEDFTQSRSTGGRKFWLIALLVLFLALASGVAYYFITGGGEAADGPGDEEDQAPVVSVISPGTTTIEGEIEATGTLAARRMIPVGVVGEGGLVSAVAVDAGDWVRKGQVLISIDRAVQNQQIASARAQIGISRADLELAQANLDRASQLIERGFISKADIDRLTATRDAARARLNVSNAQVSELQARTARLNVYAPSDGLVLERRVEPGQVVSGGSGALFMIARGGEMEMQAQVGESELAKLATGVTAEVTPVGTDRVFTGQIWQISPTINDQDRQGIARIALPYAAGLRPGGFASATIKSGTITAPLLPESAVLSDDDGAYVYIIGEENKVVRRAVETGPITDSGVTIVEGLTGTEQVVLRSGGFLTEGESVQPQKVESEKG